MPLPRVVIEGRMATEPELRFLPSGVAVCNFRVAASQRKQNPQTQQWEDDKQCFLSVAVWRDMSYDPDHNDGRGEVTTTPDIFKALAFEKSFEAWEKWKQQSRVRPLREDGRPNRPLTAFTVTVEEVPHPARNPVTPGSPAK